MGSRFRELKRQARSVDGTELSAERLHELFEYDPETGELFWKRRRAGTLNSNGYLQVNVDGRSVSVHRLAFAMMTGKFPDHEIDHKNRSRDDNRWSNLSEATRAQNVQNTGMYCTNSSGIRGVSWNKHRGAWHAKITAHGVRHHLGYFDNIDDAAAAYKEARLKLHGVER